ncbi:hypothetical protein DFH94DRAFT_763824 [Russula ochroleuca]|uniref:Secreted protein n=1 Tax=Russula ochroleuca TaxID=152965 RepID=A0A9P5K1K3_9AGAM|nr:hypothetical protein DFH94DRAFT_763824 [Russula ochroleuca]
MVSAGAIARVIFVFTSGASWQLWMHLSPPDRTHTPSHVLPIPATGRGRRVLRASKRQNDVFGADHPTLHSRLAQPTVHAVCRHVVSIAMPLRAPPLPSAYCIALVSVKDGRPMEIIYVKGIIAEDVDPRCMWTLPSGPAIYCTLADCFCGLKGRGRRCIRDAGIIVWMTPSRRMWLKTNGTVRHRTYPVWQTTETRVLHGQLTISLVTRLSQQSGKPRQREIILCSPSRSPV